MYKTLIRPHTPHRVLMASLLTAATLAIAGCAVTESLSPVLKESVSTVESAIKRSLKTPEGFKRLPSRKLDTHLVRGQTAPDDDTVEVIHVFNFMCGPCYEFNAALNPWLDANASQVTVRRVALAGKPVWDRLARLYYALHYMGLEEELFDSVFKQVIEQREWIQSLEKIAAGVKTLYPSIDETTLLETMNSSDVNNDIKVGMSVAQVAGLRGIPTLVVDRRFITDPTLVGSAANVVTALDGYVEEELANQ